MVVSSVESQDCHVAALFNEKGGKYGEAWSSLAKNRLSKQEISFILSAIESFFRNNTIPIKTLDVGVGIGRISQPISKLNVEHYGLDISEAMVGFCREKFKGNNKVKEIIVHNISEPLPRSWGQFDVITAIRLLSYTKDWSKKMENLYSALKPGGVLIFTFPNRRSLMAVTSLKWGNKGEVGSQMVTRGELRKALREAGFKKFHISGMNKLFDFLYDVCDQKIPANILFGVEKMLDILFGKTFLTREFYVVCIK